MMLTGHLFNCKRTDNCTKNLMPLQSHKKEPQNPPNDKMLFKCRKCNDLSEKL